MNINDTNILSLDDVRGELLAADASLHRARVPSCDIQLNSQQLSISGQVLNIDEDGYGVLARTVGAPAEYLKRLGVDIRERILNYHFDQGHFRSDECTVYWQDCCFIGFGRPDLTTLAAADVLDTVQEAAHEELKDKADKFIVHGFTLGKHVELDLINPEIAQEVVPGDVHQAGIRLFHSLLGEQATTIETFILRLVCQNGLVRRECVRRAVSRLRRCTTRNRDAVGHQLQEVRKITATVVRGLQSKLESIGELTEQHVDVSAYLDRQLRQVPRLHSRRLHEAMVAAWNADSGGDTAYAALNAMTSVATHNHEIVCKQRRRLAALAGVLATSTRHICPRCFSVLS